MLGQYKAGFHPRVRIFRLHCLPNACHLFALLSFPKHMPGAEWCPVDSLLCGQLITFVGCY